MRKPLIGLFFLMFLLTFPIKAHAFRCGSHLVSIGDTRYEVLRKCGAPTWLDRWQEERLVPFGGRSYLRSHRFWGPQAPSATYVYVPMEEWTYNLGPTQFTRILLFENNRLIDIATGSYGY